MVAVTALDFSFLWFQGTQCRIYRQVCTKNKDRIPESGKGRRPQPLKEVVVAPGILSLENHVATFVPFVVCGINNDDDER